MKITIFGTGYVGLVTGVCLSDLGNDVTCVDIDKEKVDSLNKGIPTIYEPGLEELLHKNIKENRLSFSSSLKEGVEKSEVLFIAVGTPQSDTGEADMRAVWSVAETIGKNINGYKIIINKSTVPVGSGDKVAEIIKQYNKTEHNYDVVSNPEFLREGSAIGDFMSPDRVVIGANRPAPADIIKQIYEPLNAPMLITDVRSAEIIKYASNAFLSVKISFINEIANLSEIVGADIVDIAKGMGLDSRIGDKFLNAGIGYGGSCFPKDTMALYSTGKEFGYEFKIVKAAIDVNKEQRKIFVDMIKDYFKNNLSDKKISVWGLAFKPNTDDMREAPSIDIINSLIEENAVVNAFDPVAMEEARHFFGDKINYFDNAYDVVKDSDALLILTEWNEFKQIDLEKVKNLLKRPIIFDGRNIYDVEYVKKIGIEYISIGRK